MDLSWNQIVGLFVLAIPVACVARTIVFEEVFREVREFCKSRSQNCNRLLTRKFFYLFTCEYCFSHWVTAGFLLLTQYRLMYSDWRGVLIAFFSLVFVSNFYLNLYARLRVDLTSEKKQIEATEHAIEVTKREIAVKDRELARSNGRSETDRPAGIVP